MPIFGCSPNGSWSACREPLFSPISPKERRHRPSTDSTEARTTGSVFPFNSHLTAARSSLSHPAGGLSPRRDGKGAAHHRIQISTPRIATVAASRPAIRSTKLVSRWGRFRAHRGQLFLHPRIALGPLFRQPRVPLRHPRIALGQLFGQPGNVRLVFRLHGVHPFLQPGHLHPEIVLSHAYTLTTVGQRCKGRGKEVAPHGEGAKGGRATTGRSPAGSARPDQPGPPRGAGGSRVQTIPGPRHGRGEPTRPGPAPQGGISAPYLPATPQ